ncbi:MAG: hypothetical protein F7B59_02960 [Desulfurococcales archaeon]|nr:hypothetical protein [Desulfurococcales archaeon]
MKHRSRYDIIAEIIRSLNYRGELGISKLALEVNLPIDRAKRIVNHLVKAKLVECYEKHRSYKATFKGLEWLLTYNRLVKELQPVAPVELRVKSNLGRI